MFVCLSARPFALRTPVPTSDESWSSDLDHDATGPVHQYTRNEPPISSLGVTRGICVCKSGFRRTARRAKPAPVVPGGAVHLVRAHAHHPRRIHAPDFAWHTLR